MINEGQARVVLARYREGDAVVLAALDVSFLLKCSISQSVRVVSNAPLFGFHLRGKSKEAFN